MLMPAQPFGEYVSRHVRRADVMHLDDAALYQLGEEVVPSLYVPRAIMAARSVLDQLDAALAVRA